MKSCHHAKNKGYFISWLLTSIMILTACSHQKQNEKSISFSNNTWQRYDILKFEFPLSGSKESYDLLFELRCSKTFAFNELPLNMILYTPSGEERIRECHLQIKETNGSFKGSFKGDTVITRLVLKKELYCSVKGVLKIEIENLNPRMQTEGVFSASTILIKN